MELPVELQQLLALGVGMVVTFLFTQLAKWGFDFSGYKSQVVAAIVGAIVLWINSLLAQVPPEAVNIVSVLLQLLIVVLGAFGIHGLYKQFKK